MVLSQLMDRLSNYAASNADVSYQLLFLSLFVLLLHVFPNCDVCQVIPDFLHVEAFAKLSNAIGKVS